MARPSKKVDDGKAANLTLVKGSKALTLADGKTRANGDAMRRAAALLGVDTPTTRGAKADQELLGSLRIEIGKRLKAIPVSEHVGCGACQEIATEDTEFCPFCGDGGGDPAQAVDAPSLEEESEEAETEEESESDDDAETEEESDDDSDEESDDDDADEPEDEPAKPAKSAKPSKSVGIAAKAKAPAKDVDAALAVQAKDLDAKVARIGELKRNMGGLTYDIGLVCKEIRDQQLFKARGHASFKAFAEAELPFTRESALALIAIVEKYPRDVYAELGYKKLRTIAAVNDTEKHDELIEAARNGASAREIQALASDTSPKEVPEKATGASTKAPDKSEKADRITLIGKIGGRKQNAKIFTPDGEVVTSVGTFLPKGLHATAYGELEVSNGVFLRVGFKINDQSELTGLTVRFVRADIEA